MGAVYEAENAWTGRRVAVKILSPKLAESSEFFERFVQEGRSATMIAHPNIVEILDMGQDEQQGSVYMVQEFLTGVGLDRVVVARGRLPLREALDIMIPVMGGLAAAHQRQIIHRDVKPENVILAQTAHGKVVPKLIDFGIAKLVGHTQRYKTMPGVLVGTPNYMAPEQLNSAEEVDAQADIWAVGVILYELLSGQAPFPGPSLPQLCTQICTADIPRIESRDANIDRALGDVVHGALVREREGRYRTMAAFLDAIAKCPSLGEVVPELMERHRDSIPYQRKHPRYDVRWSCTVTCKDWKTARQVAVANISAGGIFLTANPPPSVGTAVSIELHLPDGSRMRLGGIVLRVQKASPDGRRPGIGVRFNDEHAVALLVLEQMAAAHQEPGFQPLPQLSPAQRGRLPTEPSQRHDFGAGPPPRPSPPLSAASTAPEVSPAPPAPGATPNQPIQARSTSPRGSGPTPPRHAAAAQPKRIAGAVGIDFGTSYGSMSIAVDDRVYAVPDHKQRILHPSIVWYPERGRPVAGWDARGPQLQDPRRTVVSVKRVLGRNYDEPTLQGYLQGLATPAVRGPGGGIVFEVDGSQIAPVQVAAEFIEFLRRMAEGRLGKAVTQAVMSVPLAFTRAQRSAVRRAAEMAGLDVLELIEEPVAAALAYGYGQGRSEIVAVYDFGGGTFDFSLHELSGNNYKVLASGGDAWLGGDDFDMAIAQYAANSFWRETNVDLRQLAVEWQRLLFASEQAKRALSNEEQTEVYVERAITHPAPRHLNLPINRALLEQLCGEAFSRSMDVCRSALSEAGLQPTQVHRVILTGGTSRIPFVQRELSRFFGKDIRPVIDPDLSVGMGSGLRAALLSQHSVVEAARR